MPPAPFGATRCGRLRTDSRCSSGSNPITLRPAERPHRQTGSFRAESYGLLILPSLKDLVPPSSEMKKKTNPQKNPQPHTGKSLRKRAPKRSMKAGLEAAASARSQGSPLRKAGASLPPPALGPGSPMNRTSRQPSLMLFLHRGFIGFSLMGLSLSRRKLGGRVPIKPRPQLMNTAPGGKGRRSGGCWSHRAELAVDGLARTRFPPQWERKCQSSPLWYHIRRRDQGLCPRGWPFPHLGVLLNT